MCDVVESQALIKVAAIRSNGPHRSWNTTPARWNQAFMLSLALCTSLLSLSFSFLTMLPPIKSFFPLMICFELACANSCYGTKRAESLDEHVGRWSGLTHWQESNQKGRWFHLQHKKTRAGLQRAQERWLGGQDCNLSQSLKYY